MLFATSLADCTNCLLATWLGVLLLAILHALHKADVCFAMRVAACNTCGWVEVGLTKTSQPVRIACAARANWAWSTNPGRPTTLVGSDTPT